MFRDNKGFISLLSLFIGVLLFLFFYLILWNTSITQYNVKKTDIALNNFLNAISYKYSLSEIREGNILLTIQSTDDIPDTFIDILRKELFLNEDLSPSQESPVTEFNIKDIQLQGDLDKIYIKVQYKPKTLYGSLSNPITFASTSRLKFKNENKNNTILENIGDKNLGRGMLSFLKIPNPYTVLDNDQEGVMWPYNLNDTENIFKANTNVSSIFNSYETEYENLYGRFSFMDNKINGETKEDLNKLSIGNNHIIGLDSQGKLLGWGSNNFGQLEIPEDLTDGTVEVVDIASGANHSLALDSDGNIYTWGDNSFHQTNIPLEVNNVRKIGAGKDFSVALTHDDNFYVWGFNGFNQADVPNDEDFSDIEDISVGNQHILVLTTEGRVFGWGKNTSGQIDINKNLNTSSIWAGKNYSILKTQDGDFETYGYNEFIFPISEFDNVTEIITSPLSDHIVFLLDDDDNYDVYGKNDQNQASGELEIDPISAYTGKDVTAYQTKHTLYLIGNNDYNKLHPPEHINYTTEVFFIDTDYEAINSEDGNKWESNVYFPDETEGKFVYFNLKTGINGKSSTMLQNVPIGTNIKFENAGVWKVLSHNHFGGDKTLLMKDNSVAISEFSNNDNEWQDSKIRDFLSTDFYNELPKYFRKSILKTDVITEDNISNEEIFLLSQQELSGSDIGANGSSGEHIPYFNELTRDKGVPYWTRTPSITSDNVRILNSDSNEFQDANIAENYNIFPVINISSDTLLNYINEEGEEGEGEEGESYTLTENMPNDSIFDSWILIQNQMGDKYMNMPDGEADTQMALNSNPSNKQNHWSLVWVDDGEDRGYQILNREDTSHIVRMRGSLADYEVAKTIASGDRTFFNPIKTFENDDDEHTILSGNSVYFINSYAFPELNIGRIDQNTELLSGDEDINFRNRWELSYAPPKKPPVLKSKSSNKITFKDMGDNIEYKREGGVWQDSNEFSGLNSSTEYTFYIRYKASSSNFNVSHSKPSEGIKITTKELDVDESVIFDSWILIQTRARSGLEISDEYLTMPEGENGTQAHTDPDKNNHRNHWNLIWINNEDGEGYYLYNRAEPDYTLKINNDYQVVKTQFNNKKAIFNFVKTFTDEDGEEWRIRNRNTTYFINNQTYSDRVIGFPNPIASKNVYGVKSIALRNRWNLTYIPTTTFIMPSPQLESKSSDTITLKDMGSNIEYKKADGVWQNSRRFTDLQPDTEYMFFARNKRTSINGINVSSSKPSEGTSIRTDNFFADGSLVNIVFDQFSNKEEGIYLGRVGLNIEKYLTITRFID